MLSDNLKAKIEIYCYFINKGKPTAMEPIKDKDIKETIDIVKKNGLDYFKKNLLRKDWEAFGYDNTDKSYVQVWIYKKPIMLDVIKKMPKRPKTIYDHWILGKIFGFSDEKIEEFIIEYLSLNERSNRYGKL